MSRMATSEYIGARRRAYAEAKPARRRYIFDEMCEAAAVKPGKEPVPDEARLRAEYDLTLREITRRLKAERSPTKS